MELSRIARKHFTFGSNIELPTPFTFDLCEFRLQKSLIRIREYTVAKENPPPVRVLGILKPSKLFLRSRRKQADRQMFLSTQIVRDFRFFSASIIRRIFE